MNEQKEFEFSGLGAFYRAIQDDVPWGSWDDHFRDMETALRLALEATSAYLNHWEDDLEDEVWERWGGDEFYVPAEVVAAFEPEERLIYVARLLETLALAYGVSLNSHGAGLNPLGYGPTPAGLLRALNDESWLGRMTPDSSPGAGAA